MGTNTQTNCDESAKSEREISVAIADRLKNSEGPSGRNPKSWTIGITNYPVERRKEHKADGKPVKYWECWKANDKGVAEAVERHWKHEMDMKGGTGGNTDGSKPVYVYIF